MNLRRCLVGLGIVTSLWLAGPARAQVELFQLATVDDVPTRIDFRSELGRGLQFDDGFAALDYFLPVYQLHNLVFFTDYQAAFAYDGNNRRFSTGGGVRYFSEGFDRVLGGYLLYDNGSTGRHTFQQLTLGWESLGDYWDLRGNFYIPLGDRTGILSESISAIRFQNVNIILGLDRTAEVLPRGLDFEGGLVYPLMENVQLRSYLGYYNYHGRNIRPIHGIRARVEAHMLDLLSVDASIQNDPEYDTTVYAGVGIRFGGPSSRHGEICLPDRRAERIERAPFIVAPRTTEREELGVARYSDNGRPIIVRHLNADAGAGGDGSIERPFNTLAALQAGSQPGEILFVHADGLFTPATTFQMQFAQRLLGEGVPHFVQTTRGEIALPRATSGVNAPTIVVNPGTSGVTLARNNEVSGISFSGSALAVSQGITGTGDVGFFNINRNAFAGFGPLAGSAGVALTNVNGLGLIQGNLFQGGNLFGINIQQAVATSTVDVGIRDNTFRNSLAPFQLQTVQGRLGAQNFNNNSSNNTNNNYIYLPGAAGRLLLEDNFVTSVPITNPPPGVIIVPTGFLNLPPLDDDDDD